MLAASLTASTTQAQPAKKKPTPIDVKPVIDDLEVYRNDTGMYVVMARYNTLRETHAKWVFYGTEKAMYQQRIVGYFSDAKQYEYMVWAPRARGLNNGSIAHDERGARMECEAKAEPQRLVQLPADEARQFLLRATFLPPLWERQVQFLARDEDGVYYYVDRQRDEFGGKDYRVFVGQKGAMKQMAMKNVVNDSAGEIYATKTGELKIVAGKNGNAMWKKGNKKIDLVVLDPYVNRYLIYRELGIYGTLGALCDEY